VISAYSLRQLRDHLEKMYGLTYLDPRSPGSATALDAVGAAVRVASEFVTRTLGIDHPALGTVIPDFSTVSMTLGPYVLLSEAAVANLASEIETIVHEAQHGSQNGETTYFQAAVDYLSPELRARAEADAYAAGLFARYLVTGVFVAEQEAVDRLVAGPYHLALPELALARSIVRSHVATIAEGLCPPISAAIETYSFLRLIDPAAIVVEIQ